MCQTAFISQNIVRLGTRSYKHSLEAMVPEEYSVGQLRRLNRDLDTFYEYLYSQCNDVTESEYDEKPFEATESEYKVFEKQLDSMLTTLRALYMSCKKMPSECGVADETEKLRMNYVALYELNNDIKNYRINAPRDTEWTALLSDAGNALKSIAHD